MSACDLHLHEARRALSRSGAGFTELQRRAVAAVCLIAGCTAELAEAAMAEAERRQVSRGFRLWYPGEDELEGAVNKALLVIGADRQRRRPKLRLLHGGAS